MDKHIAVAENIVNARAAGAGSHPDAANARHGLHMAAPAAYLASMSDTLAARPISPLLKLVLEIGPLAVFFLTFRYAGELLADPEIFGWIELATGARALEGEGGPVFLATACFMVAIAASLGASWWLTRALPRMAVVTAVVVAVFGGLTLWLQDETFIKMKPTIVNAIFAAILGFGLLQGRSYLRYLMGEAMPLTARGWIIFTRNWVIFFVVCAVLNEIVWRTQSTEFWVSFKTFFYLPFTFVFVVLHWPFLQRHAVETPGK
jgi:intracellular septation protein